MALNEPEITPDETSSDIAGLAQAGERLIARSGPADRLPNLPDEEFRREENLRLGHKMCEAAICLARARALWLARQK